MKKDKKDKKTYDFGDHQKNEMPLLLSCLTWY
jgi:hypothetical protein